jgi:hypothetical protein
LSFPQAPEPGVPPPEYGHGDQRPSNSGMGVASLACAAAVVPSMMVTSVPATFVSLFTRPDHGRSGREWVASTVFFGAPVLFTLLSLIFGLVALRRAPRGSKDIRTGVAGLVAGSLVAIIVLLPTLQQDF